MFFSDLSACLFVCLFVSPLACLCVCPLACLCFQLPQWKTKFYCLIHNINNNIIENNCRTFSELIAIDFLEFLVNRCCWNRLALLVFWFSNWNENNLSYLVREARKWNRFCLDMFSFVQYVIAMTNAEKGR